MAGLDAGIELGSEPKPITPKQEQSVYDGEYSENTYHADADLTASAVLARALYGRDSAWLWGSPEGPRRSRLSS